MPPDASSCPTCGTALAAPPGPGPAWDPVVARLREALAGELEILAPLGHGGMAAVFLARELALNRRVALKVMAPGLLMGEGMVERFRQEAVTVANLQHAHIVSVHGVRTVGDLHLYVMQYVAGRSLDRALRDHGALAPAVARAIVYHVGSALDYAHRRGVIHRDIKPANILLNPDGDAVVTDFGIAKVAEAPGYTRAGMVVGTPAYMSPEQCLGAPDITGASDQYSLGVVAYEMLAGRPPFEGSGLPLMRAHIDRPPPALRLVRPDLPESLETAVLRMLAKRPADRFPDMPSALAALDARPIGAHDPERLALRALAGSAANETRLADVVQASRSPAPVPSRSPPPSRSPLIGLPGATPAADRSTAPPALPAPAAPHGAAPAPSRVASPPARPTPPAAPIVEVVIAGPSTLVVGTTAQLRAVARARRGRADDPPTAVDWRSAHPTVASVSPDGLVSALAPGHATVIATCGGGSGEHELSVVRVAAASVHIVSAPRWLRLGEHATLRATVRDATGRRIDRMPVWRSTAPAVVSVDSTGRITARAEGWAIVTADADGVDAHAEIVVRQHLIPPSASGRRELHASIWRWLLFLALVGAAAAAGSWWLGR